MYQGKVRDIYDQGETLKIVSTDRISAFNRSFKEPIPGKGRILNQLSKFWFEKTGDIIQNHLIETPEANTAIVKKCTPLRVEVVVRGYLCGSLWRDYKAGKRRKCGVTLPDGLIENQKLPRPIITPTLKNKEDTEMSAEEIIASGVLSKELWQEISQAALRLFERGTEVLRKRGMILVDTKYEFGLDREGRLTLIDELHTPDSSRFWYAKEPGRFFDKEFIREWLLEHGGDSLPPHIVRKASENYQRLYQTITEEP